MLICRKSNAPRLHLQILHTETLFKNMIHRPNQEEHTTLLRKQGCRSIRANHQREVQIRRLRAWLGRYALLIICDPTMRGPVSRAATAEGAPPRPGAAVLRAPETCSRSAHAD